MNVPDGTKSWNTWKYLVSATPLICVRIALAADGSTVASAAEPSPKRVPDPSADRRTPVIGLMSLLIVRVPVPLKSYSNRGSPTPDSVSVAVSSGVCAEKAISASPLNIDVPATSSAAVTVSDIPPIANRDPPPTSENVVASSVAAPL